MTLAYCVKCKAKKAMRELCEVEMKAKGGGKRPAIKGICVDCGTTLFKIVAAKRD